MVSCANFADKNVVTAAWGQIKVTPTPSLCDLFMKWFPCVELSTLWPRDGIFFTNLLMPSNCIFNVETLYCKCWMKSRLVVDPWIQLYLFKLCTRSVSVFKSYTYRPIVHARCLVEVYLCRACYNWVNKIEWKSQRHSVYSI